MTEPTMPELLPCPFCGGSRIKAHYIRDGRSIGCADCGATLHAFNGPYDITTRLITAWSRRALPADPPAEWIEAMARGVCKQQGWGQCAAICLSELHPDGQAGKCSHATTVWGRQVRAAYAALARKMGGGDAE